MLVDYFFSFVAVAASCAIVFGGALTLGYLLAIIFDYFFKSDDASISSRGTDGVAQECGLQFMTNDERRCVLLRCLDIKAYGQEPAEQNANKCNSIYTFAHDDHFTERSSLVVQNENCDIERNNDLLTEAVTEDCAICLSSYGKKKILLKMVYKTLLCTTHAMRFTHLSIRRRKRRQNHMQPSLFAPVSF